MKKFAFLILLLPFVFFFSADALELKSELARLKSTGGEYRFVVFGDNRSGDNIYKKIAGQALNSKPLFIVNTGDIIPNPGNREQWKNFWKISKDVNVPYFLTPGNHDINSAQSEKVWRDEVDLPGLETYYSFEVGPDLFVVLNTCDPSNDRKIAGKQLIWLKRILTRGNYRNKFVFLHHPLFLWQDATHYQKSLDKYPASRDELHRLFSKNAVNAVFVGHEHIYRDQGKLDGVHYFVTGGAGAPKYGKDSFNNLMVVDVYGNGVIAAKVLDKDGHLRDEPFIKMPQK